LFLPSYVGALAWSMLGSPAAGLVNVAFRDLGIPLSIDMYTLTGLVVVLGMYYAPYAFLLVHSAFSMMNPDLEDAAHVHGGSMRKVLSGVTFPLALPAILGSGLLVFTLIFENFPVAQTLGSPGGIETLPTFIYRLMNAFPAVATRRAALAVVLVAVVLGATLLQRWLISRRSYTTVSGKGVRARRVPLGAWRWPVVAVALVYLVAAIVAPLGALLLTAIRTSPVMLSFRELTEPGRRRLRRLPPPWCPRTCSSGRPPTASWSAWPRPCSARCCRSRRCTSPTGPGRGWPERSRPCR
jgi:iron(III) transport system permease protein